MTQEEKQLILKDLCARLPYRVMLNVDNGMYREDTTIWPGLFNSNSLWDAKPYLRSMSSMTKEEFNEYMRFIKHSWEGIDKKEDDYYVKVKDRGVYIDWLNAHHFDYRDLIPMGLALEAPEGMYKIGNE